MDRPAIKIPSHLSYAESHEWIAQDSDVCTVGITDHGQSMLGDLVFVELPEVGEYFEAGQPFGRVTGESLVAELYAPISGEVLDVNQTLEDHAEQVNTDPYGGGWMIEIRLEDPEETARLLSAQEYGDLIAGL